VAVDTTYAEGTMPITLNCTCGKTLRVADEHAGKRVKCPVCNAVITPPAPEPEFEIVEDVPKPPTSTTSPAKPAAKPEPEADEEYDGSVYGLAKSEGGEEADEPPPRKKELPDFRLGSGRRDAKRKKK
jgi:hypothetical protein